MNYTPEQLREWARDWDETRGKAPISEILRAHADALDKLARIEAAQPEDVLPTVRLLLDWASHEPVSRCIVEKKAAALLESLSAKLAEREAELAKLRQHADAMFNWITGDGEYCAIKECEACAIGRAYRANFKDVADTLHPKEGMK